MLKGSTGLLMVVGLALAGCAGDDRQTVGSVEVPQGATFCSIFNGQYREALGNAVPITDEAFEETIGEIVAWADVLVPLAPEEIAEEASDNLRYHQAQAAVSSAAAFIPGSNAMHAWANEHCGSG